MEDLLTLDEIVRSGRVDHADTDAWQALGLALGRVMVSELDGFDWCVIDDDDGRDICLRYETTSLMIFPVTMLSKRVEAGAPVDVMRIFGAIEAEVARAVTEGVD
ncbi:DUF3806 domain-containing protein [Rhodobacterales bacterium HKCCE2091]|nr:DUF3806 domain-containing protein [Rhodobacterales bacterium HKCCE2091]